jgi:hypothetical protein
MAKGGNISQISLDNIPECERDIYAVSYNYNNDNYDFINIGDSSKQIRVYALKQTPTGQLMYAWISGEQGYNAPLSNWKELPILTLGRDGCEGLRKYTDYDTLLKDSATDGGARISQQSINALLQLEQGTTPDEQGNPNDVVTKAGVFHFDAPEIIQRAAAELFGGFCNRQPFICKYWPFILIGLYALKKQSERKRQRK